MFRLRYAGGNEGFNVQGSLILHIFVGDGASMLLWNRTLLAVGFSRTLQAAAMAARRKDAKMCDL
jgi:hypothetical protein